MAGFLVKEGLVVKKIFGVGINDAGYETQKFVKVSEGKWKRVWVCPFYRTWKHMLERGYCNKLKRKYPTYLEVGVCDEWLLFSNFRSWMETQKWEGNALDKDILLKGNKLYSPEHCIFISKELNNFLTNTQRVKTSKLPKGVCWNKDHEKYQVRINNPFTNKRENLGYYTSSVVAAKVWRKRKSELAYQWSGLVEDARLKSALLLMTEDYF